MSIIDKVLEICATKECKRINCRSCRGSGWYDQKAFRECWMCGGTGKRDGKWLGIQKRALGIQKNLPKTAIELEALKESTRRSNGELSIIYTRRYKSAKEGARISLERIAQDAGIIPKPSKK